MLFAGFAMCVKVQLDKLKVPVLSPGSPCTSSAIGAVSTTKLDRLKGQLKSGRKLPVWPKKFMKTKTTEQWKSEPRNMSARTFLETPPRLEYDFSKMAF